MLRDRAEAFGEASFETISSVVHVEEHGWAADRVNAAMERLNRASSERPYRAVVLWMRSANAFTMPGRYLYVGRELLSRGLSEEGVAFVLAHEMAHHALGHLDSFEQVLESEGSPALAKMRAWLEHMAARVLRYSPDQERDADAWALRLCAEAGYDERGALELFDLMQRIALDYRALDSVFGGEAPGAVDAWVARVAGLGPTHPAIVERREAILRLVGSSADSPPEVDPQPAPEGFTSTLMVCACADCAVRFAPMPRCPRCGSSSIGDLRDPMERSTLVRELYRSASPRGRARHLPGAGAIASASGGFVAYLLATGTELGNAVAGGLLALLGGTALYGIAAGLAQLSHEYSKWDRMPGRLARAARLDPLPLRVGEAGDPQVDGVGTVHMLRAVNSPLSGRRCAAYRVVGEGPSGEIDDAEIGELEIVGPWGRARVQGDGLLRLDVEQRPSPASIGSELEAFLRARGVFPKDAEVQLAEAILVEGDRVRVRGTGETRIVSGGMRSQESVVFLRWPEIERIDAPDEG